jgi:beta-galactosidase
LGYWQRQQFYPWNLAYCGDIDICGWKRPQSYYRDALWKSNQVSVFVKPPQPSFPVNPQKVSWSHWEWHDVVASWNWEGHEQQPLQVEVYSSCEKVELFLNGHSLGKQTTDRAHKYTATFQVPYQPGKLEAVGYNGNKKITTAVLSTAAAPDHMQLTADRTSIHAANQDLSYITVELLDANGVRNPTAENEVQFSVEGPGAIVGVGNANPVSTESCQLPRRKAWQGRCLVIIKATGSKGNIVLKAKAAGLPGAQVTIAAQ